jgi:hypothetical protein
MGLHGVVASLSLRRFQAGSIPASVAKITGDTACMAQVAS